MAAYRTDEKKSADTALLIGVLSVALRPHVSKVPRAVDPAWRDVRTITDVKWLLRSSGSAIAEVAQLPPVLPAS